MDRRELLNDEEEALRIAMDGQQAAMWTGLPVIVTAIDFEKSTIECQPAIQGVNTDENGNDKFVDLPLLADVPISWPRAGGFVITFPIKVGDEMYVSFASRGIDWWWQNGGIQKPAEARMHDLSDAIAFFGPSSLPNVVANISSTDMQLRNDAGTASISITADGKIKILGDLQVTGEVTAKFGTIAPIELSTHTHPTTEPHDPTGPPLP